MSNTCSNNHFRSPTILKYPLWNFHLELCVLCGKSQMFQDLCFRRRQHFSKFARTKAAIFLSPLSFFLLWLFLTHSLHGVCRLYFSACSVDFPEGVYCSKRALFQPEGREVNSRMLYWSLWNHPWPVNLGGMYVWWVYLKDQVKADSRESTRRRETSLNLCHFAFFTNRSFKVPLHNKTEF